MRPGHPDQIVLAFVLPGPATHRWRVYDLIQKKVLFTYEAKFPKFSPDGNVLVSDQDHLTAGAKLKVHNLDHLMDIEQNGP